MPIHHMLGLLFCTIGCLFFFAGTVGIIRFQDTCSRLHALTKADNLGLGFLVLGVGLQGMSFIVFCKLILIWLLSLAGSALACYLISSQLTSNITSPSTKKLRS